MLKILLFAVALYAIACLFLYFKQRDILFFAMPENNQVDASVLWLETEDARLKIWQFNEGKDAILYFGGNAEAVEQNIVDFRHLFKDFTVYLVNYRGYGGSSGSPSEKALFDDALAIFDELKKDHDIIHVIGRSLGSGVGCYLAQQKPVKKLVLLTPYDSVQNVAQSHYPLFPVKWLIKDKFDSISRAGFITSPVLVLMAENDKVVPLQHSQNLIQALTATTVESHIINGTQHNNITSAPQSLEYLKHFVTADL
jgi:pimeloyl-ACP methyl ester carboxylesterase